MADQDALVQAQFQVPASEVQAGLNGRLLLTANLQAASSETIQQTEEVKNIVEQSETEVNNLVQNFETEVSTRLGYKYSVNTVTGTSYTLVESDEGGLVRMTSDDANTVFVPANASVPFEIGTIVTIRQAGLGQTVVEGETGVTINGPAEPFQTDGTDFGVAIVKVDTDEWDFIKSFKAVPLPEVTDFANEVDQVFNDLDSQLEDAKAKADAVQNALNTQRAELKSDDQLLRGRIEARETKDIEQDDKIGNIQQDLLTENDFANSKTSNGYQKLPGGLILQWMSVSPSIDPQAKKTFDFNWPDPSLWSTCLIPIMGQVGRFEAEEADAWTAVVGFDSQKVTVEINMGQGGQDGPPIIGDIHILGIGF